MDADPVNMCSSGSSCTRAAGVRVALLLQVIAGLFFASFFHPPPLHSPVSDLFEGVHELWALYIFVWTCGL
jgi:hypothetical protein